MPAEHERLLTGWGRTAATRAGVVEASSPEDVASALGAAARRGAIPRGLGRSYGDAAQNAGGLVVDTTPLNRIADLDVEGAELTAGAGVSIHQLIGALLPFGLFPPVTPGTRYVTLGGAIAADIHGKNHHVDGAFGRHVRSMELLTPDGQARTVGPGEDAFAATTGGMGLTGIISCARIGLTRVESAYMTVDTVRAGDLDALMATMTEHDDRRYTVAWIDCLARGRNLGRGVVTSGNHAPRDALSDKQRRDPLRFTARPLIGVPVDAPDWILNGLTMRSFNEAWFQKARLAGGTAIQPLSGFFHPLDGVNSWNRLYGRRGLVQYQAVVPPGADGAIRAMVERLSSASAASFLAVLKRMGPGSGLLSFPIEGWTLALDMPARLPGLAQLLDDLDELVAAAGGRIYLAKDSRMRPDLLDAMYPELPRWREIQTGLDPAGVMRSDLSRRLRLTNARVLAQAAA